MEPFKLPARVAPELVQLRAHHYSDFVGPQRPWYPGELYLLMAPTPSQGYKTDFASYMCKLLAEREGITYDEALRKYHPAFQGPFYDTEVTYDNTTTPS